MQIDLETEKSERPNGNMKVARATVREAYKEITTDINAQIPLYHAESELFIAFVKTHNVAIEKYRNIVVQCKGCEKFHVKHQNISYL